MTRVNIPSDRKGYKVNVFLISPQKHMLRVDKYLGKALLMSVTTCFCGEIKKKNINTFLMKKVLYLELCA